MIFLIFLLKGTILVFWRHILFCTLPVMKKVCCFRNKIEIMKFCYIINKVEIIKIHTILVQLVKPFLTCKKKNFFHIIAKIFHILSILWDGSEKLTMTHMVFGLSSENLRLYIVCAKNNFYWFVYLIKFNTILSGNFYFLNISYKFMLLPLIVELNFS